MAKNGAPSALFCGPSVAQLRVGAQAGLRVDGGLQIGQIGRHCRIVPLQQGTSLYLASKVSQGTTTPALPHRIPRKPPPTGATSVNRPEAR